MIQRFYILFSLLPLLLLFGCTVAPTPVPSSYPIDAQTTAPVDPNGGATLTITPVASFSDPTPAVPGDWKLVWADEFEGKKLDSNRWTTCYWWADSGCTIISNHELEWYQPRNVSIQDGNLVLEARKEQVEGPDGKMFPYTSGMVSSGRATSEMGELPRYSFQYGYVEMRAKIPAGRGIWPAFWLLPITHESRPEIDIMEILGHEPGNIKFNYHYIDADGNKADTGSEWAGPDFSQDWHTFGVDWAPDQITWYVDGVKRYEMTDAASISSEPMYILLNLAVGGDWPGSPDGNTVFPSQYLIDYVRVYQHGQ